MIADQAAKTARRGAPSDTFDFKVSHGCRLRD